MVLAFGVNHLSTGDLFRAAQREKDPLGVEAFEAINRGELVPDRIVIGLVTSRLEKIPFNKGWLLDGFPRTVEQAIALDDYLSKRSEWLTCVVLLAVEKDRIINRLKDRRVCRDCGRTYHLVFHPPTISGECDFCGGELYQRKDDRTETIRKRLEIYELETAPLVDYYERKGKLIRVDGEKKVDEVSDDIQVAVKDLL